MTVTKNTRAKQDGTFIVCPSCECMQLVYHFAWSALTCQTCENSIVKTDWELLPK